MPRSSLIVRVLSAAIAIPAGASVPAWIASRQNAIAHGGAIVIRAIANVVADNRTIRGLVFSKFAEFAHALRTSRQPGARPDPAPGCLAGP
jgi:hypothetical protein